MTSIIFNKIPSTLSPRIEESTDQKIPRIIHQTFKTNSLSDKLYEGVRSIIDHNPTYRYEFYDDDRMKDFVGNFDCRGFSFSKDQLLSAFNSIKPGAGRADILRYLIMYEIGGIYIDIDSKCIKSLDSSISSTDDIVTCKVGEAYNHDRTSEQWKHLFPQWFLMYSPKCLIMKSIIEHCITAINTRTPIPNSENCINLLERYTGACVSNYVYRKILNFKDENQEDRLKNGTYKLNHRNEIYTISILDKIPNVFNDTLINKNFSTIPEYQQELKINEVSHWLYEEVFNE
jgi:mannosyltransferase OCH1-like enzyme